MKTIVKDGIYDWTFQFVKGGFDMRISLVNELNVLKGIFPSIQRETSIRLAHKGLFPLKTDKGYIYMVDKDNKLIGSSVFDEYTKYLIETQPKNNRNLRRAERAELKLFNLLK